MHFEKPVPRLLGILGYPLKHSLSPAFQQAALDYYCLEVRYEAWETHPRDLAARVRQLRAKEVLGFNVTVPHKEAVCSLLDQLVPEAARIGAVNTVLNQEGRLTGLNTDVYGFIRALKEDGAFDPKGKRALILGAGGSAKAVAPALAREGVAAITIANRTLERAEALAKLVRGLGRVEVRAIALQRESLRQAAQGTDLIVNCTSLGMRHGPADGQSPLPWDLIPANCLVYDLVYNPPETPLLLEAKRAGARTLGGLPMLIYQGAAAFKLWTGKEPPLEVMFAAARKALG